MSRPFSKAEDNLAFAQFEDLRHNKNLTVSDISIEAEGLLPLVRADGQTVLNHKQISHKYITEGRKAFPGSKNVRRDMLTRGFSHHFSRKSWKAIQGALQRALQLNQDSAKSSTQTDVHLNEPDTETQNNSSPKSSSPSRSESRPLSRDKPEKTFPPRVPSQPRLTRARQRKVGATNGSSDVLKPLPAKVEKSRIQKNHARLAMTGSDQNGGDSTASPAKVDHHFKIVVSENATTSKSLPQTEQQSLPNTLNNLYNHQIISESQEMEQQFTTLRSILLHHGRKYAPSHRDVAQIFDTIDDHVHNALENFMKATSFGSLTTTSLTETPMQLCHTLVGGSKFSGVRERTQTLCNHPAVTPITWLKACAFAGILHWALLGFEEDTPAIIAEYRAKAYTPFANAVPLLHARFCEITHLCYLDLIVKPTLANHSQSLTQDLFNTLMEFRKGASIVEDDGSRRVVDPETQGSYFKAWEKSMAAAFHEALLLRLHFAASPLKYHYSCPSLNDPFSMDTMEPSRDITAGEMQSRVWLCTRPLILSIDDNRDKSTIVTVMRARVILA